MQGPAYILLQNLLQNVPLCSQGMRAWAGPEDPSVLALLMQRLCVESEHESGRHLRAPLLHALANAAVTGAD